MSVVHTLFFFFLQSIICAHTLKGTHSNSLSLLKVWGSAQEVGPALGSLVKQFLVKFNRGLWFKPPLPSHSISSVVIPIFSCCTLLLVHCPLSYLFLFPLPHPSFFIYSYFLHSPLTFYGTSVPVLTNLLQNMLIFFCLFFFLKFLRPLIQPPESLAEWFQDIFQDWLHN